MSKCYVVLRWATQVDTDVVSVHRSLRGAERVAKREGDTCSDCKGSGRYSVFREKQQIHGACGSCHGKGYAGSWIQRVVLR